MTEYLSKIQVKNLLTKTYGVWEMRRSIKGRICSEYTKGYYTEAAENGFVKVAYFANSTYATRESAEARRLEAMAKAYQLAVTQGFEIIRDGDALLVRKAR